MTDLITVRRDHLETMLAYLASGPWTPTDKPEVAEAWKGLTEAKDAGLDAAAPGEPPLPPGEYATVEIMGHDAETGWVTDGTRGGVPVLVIRNMAGRVVREVPGHSMFTYIPLPTPLRRPEPELAALPAGHYEGDYAWQPESDDQDEPADALAGSTEPDPF